DRTSLRPQRPAGRAQALRSIIAIRPVTAATSPLILDKSQAYSLPPSDYLIAFHLHAYSCMLFLSHVWFPPLEPIYFLGKSSRTPLLPRAPPLKYLLSRSTANNGESAGSTMVVFLRAKVRDA